MAEVIGRDDEELNANKRKFHDFLDFNDDGSDKYANRLQKVIDKKTSRLMVDLDDLRAFDSELATRLLRAPSSLLPAFESAVMEAALDISPNLSKEDPPRAINVGLEGSFGRHRVTPRSLLSPLLGCLVCVEGISTKISIVHPKVVRTVHYCPATNKMLSREYRDATSMNGLPTGSVYPKQDDEGNLLETEFGLSTYADHQTLTVQEMPEHAPLGQLPSSIQVVLGGDLVDRCKPGDRVQVVGVFRGVSRAAKGLTSGIFNTVLVANSINLLQKDANPDEAEDISDADVAAIRTLAEREDVFDLLSRSVAPSIFGHEFIKKAILMQLLGGVEKNLENGTHIRGDINVLMVGDPSTAKSQLLRYVLHSARLAISTTGRGSSGVGLTAAVTSDPDTGERRLEAGAMVLADRGVVCIDEFDKMSELDRVAIHEVMEQQTVTIAKAGIHCSLNARCSVIAAANPIYGQYDRELTAQRNIGMPDSLLSRFDLLFIVLDDLDDEHNSKIARHVLRLHRFQRPGQEGEPIPVGGHRGLDGSLVGGEDDCEEVERKLRKTPVFEKFNPLLHSGVLDLIEAKAKAAGKGAGKAIVPEVVSSDFLKKYVQFCKTNVQPVLTQRACEMITSAYTELRQKSGQHTMVVTARQLETLIRLSTAHAKCRLSSSVEALDVNVAKRILSFALYHDNDGEALEENPDSEEEADLSGDENVGPTNNKSPRKRSRGPASDGDSPSSKRRQTSGESTGGDALKAIFKAFIAKQEDQGDEGLDVEAAITKFMEGRPPLKAGAQKKLKGKLMVLLREMENIDECIMVSDGRIYIT